MDNLTPLQVVPYTYFQLLASSAKSPELVSLSFPGMFSIDIVFSHNQTVYIYIFLISCIYNLTPLQVIRYAHFQLFASSAKTPELVSLSFPSVFSVDVAHVHGQTAIRIYLPYFHAHTILFVSKSFGMHTCCCFRRLQEL